MKTRLIFLVLLIVSFSCGTNNKPVSDAQKEKIKGEVKEVVNTIVKGAEEANTDMIIGSYLDSPDFVFTYNGNSFNYKQFADLAKSVFGTLKNQKGTIVDEKYAVIDNSTVLYTANTKWLMNFKDGHAILQDPWTMQYIFKKVDSKWKVISGNESGVEQSVKNSETSNQLNQLELIKQFIGNWTGEIGKDTTAILEYTLFGTGIEDNYKAINKGKILYSEKGLWGYDKKNDKIFHAQLWDYSPDLQINVWRYTSKNICEGIQYQDISNPENASLKWKIEFKSPDLWVMTTTLNSKVVSTLTFTRIKK